MGVVYNLSKPCRCHMNNDGFCIVDDRSRISFSTRYRSASYSETASSLYHTCLLTICRVGHIHDATSQGSLPGTRDQLKTIQTIEKARDTSKDLLALSANRIVRARSVSYDDRFRDSAKALEGPIHQSRFDLVPSVESASIDSKPQLRRKSLGDSPTAVPRKLLIDTVKERQAAGIPQEQQVISSFSKSNDYAADVPLPSSRFSMRLVDRTKRRQHGTTAIAGKSEKREREDSDDDITQIPVERKKAKRRTLKVTVSVKAHEAKGEFSASPVKPGDQPSLFDVARRDYPISWTMAEAH